MKARLKKGHLFWIIVGLFSVTLLARFTFNGSHAIGQKASVQQCPCDSSGCVSYTSTGKRAKNATMAGVGTAQYTGAPLPNNPMYTGAVDEAKRAAAADFILRMASCVDTTCGGCGKEAYDLIIGPGYKVTDKDFPPIPDGAVEPSKGAEMTEEERAMWAEVHSKRWRTVTVSTTDVSGSLRCVCKN